ncbi:hypothetical protein [Hymenobacter negativus]|uniref:Lipoprotein n=1 Tax=Hymenobacter negativus TaxID=2795026 RepID=A0ABS3QML4_9BACT|nr:hypothetical protein [Hymenobacter negativus]MBO2012188.1 hypothetical protein [Hymenobacter negativus]
MRLSFLPALALLAACRPDVATERLPTAPLLETVPAGYRPVERTDTLPSYWAAPEAYANNAFDFTPAYLSQVQLQVQLVPASAAHGPAFDTLTFHGVTSGYGLGREGLNWIFGVPPRRLTSALLDSRGEPAKVFTATFYSLVITEESVNKAGYRYTRNRYTTEYPFCPVAVAHAGDSVAYVRAYLLRGNMPRPDTLYAASSTSPPQHLPHEADRPDTTRQVLLRFSLRQLRHSATPAGY